MLWILTLLCLLLVGIAIKNAADNKRRIDQLESVVIDVGNIVLSVKEEMIDVSFAKMPLPSDKIN